MPDMPLTGDQLYRPLLQRSSVGGHFGAVLARKGVPEAFNCEATTPYPAAGGVEIRAREAISARPASPAPAR